MVSLFSLLWCVGVLALGLTAEATARLLDCVTTHTQHGLLSGLLGSFFRLY